MQGTKIAGNEWFEWSSKIFGKMGMAKTNIDNIVFTFRHGTDLLIILSKVDDLLILSSSQFLYEIVSDKLKTTFDITTQESNIISASKQELKELEIEFGGTYLMLYGKLLHVATIARPQIFNALTSFGKFQAIPCMFAFNCLRRIFQYLATYPNVPIIYPKQPLNSTTPFVSFHHQRKMNIIYCLTSFVDSNFATDLSDRWSISSDIIILGSVAVSWKVHKDMAITSSLTDAETRAVRRIITGRNFFTGLGFPISAAAPMYEDNKGTRDLIHANIMTRQTKHVDLRLCYDHEK